MRRRFTNPYIDYTIDPTSNNLIIYTTKDGNAITLYRTEGFGSNCIQNDYSKATGKGVLLFDGPITSIGDYAFYGCSNLKTILLPSTVTTIGSNSFRDTGLTYINFHVGLTSIGSWAFEDCAWLDNIVFSTTITSIGAGAFSGCSKLFSVIIPDSVETIDYLCFTDCLNLNNIHFGNGLNNISARMCSGCTNLASVTLGENITSIAVNAFSNCTSLNTLTFLHVNVPNLFYTNSDDYKNIRSLIKNIILNKAKSLEKESFRTFTALETINLPNNIVSIGEYAFYGCERLTNFKFGNQPNLTTIGQYAFSYCGNSSSSLFNITLPDTITELNQYAFSYCTNLKGITIPKNLKILSDGLFKGCSKLYQINLPEGLTEIGISTFEDCTGLKVLYMSSTITNIKKYAFREVSFDKIYLSNLVSYLKINYDDVNRTDYSCCPAYKGAYFYLNNSLITTLTIPSSVNKIPHCAFRCKENKSHITTLKFESNSVKYIGDYAFCFCNTIKSVYTLDLHPDSFKLSYIGDYAFFDAGTFYCNFATDADGVKWYFIASDVIGLYAFYNCKTPAKNCYIVANEIKDYAFYQHKITDVLLWRHNSMSFPSVQITIGDYAFFTETKHKVVVCTKKVPSIKANTFFVDAVTGIYAPSSIQSEMKSGWYMFKNKLFYWASKYF